MSIESVMPSNHLILCRSLLLLPSFFPSIGVLSNESVCNIRWPKYQSYSISPSKEYSGLISFRRASPAFRSPRTPHTRPQSGHLYSRLRLVFGLKFSCLPVFQPPPLAPPSPRSLSGFPHPCHSVVAAFGWQNIPLIHSARNFLNFSFLPHHDLFHLCVPGPGEQRYSG